MRTVVVSLLALALWAPAAAAQSSVTVVGDMQSEVGCSTDWKPDCAQTRMTKNADGIWRETLTLPVGSFSWKVALNDSWDVNYGANGAQGGNQIPLQLSASQAVRFYFDPFTHWLTDSRNSVIAAAVGSFQSELGCPGDWSPSCLRTLMRGTGDGTYRFTTSALAAGNYEMKVALNESWNENYGLGGAANGANVVFTVATDGARTDMTYDAVSHAITAGPPAVAPTATPTPSAEPSVTATPDPGPTATATPPPTTVADVTQPTLKASGAGRKAAWRSRKGKRVRFVLGEPSRVTWALRTRAGRTLGRGAFTLPAGTTTRALKLSRKGRKRLRAARRIVLVVVATDAAGNRTTVRG